MFECCYTKNTVCKYFKFIYLENDIPSLNYKTRYPLYILLPLALAHGLKLRALTRFHLLTVAEVLPIVLTCSRLLTLAEMPQQLSHRTSNQP